MLISYPCVIPYICWKKACKWARLSHMLCMHSAHDHALLGSPFQLSGYLFVNNCMVTDKFYFQNFTRCSIQRRRKNSPTHSLSDSDVISTTKRVLKPPTNNWCHIQFRMGSRKHGSHPSYVTTEPIQGCKWHWEDILAYRYPMILFKMKEASSSKLPKMELSTLDALYHFFFTIKSSPFRKSNRRIAWNYQYCLEFYFFINHLHWIKNG